MSKTLTSYKDVMIAYFQGGIARVEALHLSRPASASTARRALKEARLGTADVTELEAWVADTFGAIGRGRSSPEAGDTRTYKAQNLKGARDHFIRLPVNSIGVAKGGQLRVQFFEGEIRITPMRAAVPMIETSEE